MTILARNLPSVMSSFSKVFLSRYVLVVYPFTRGVEIYRGWWVTWLTILDLCMCIPSFKRLTPAWRFQRRFHWKGLCPWEREPWIIAQQLNGVNKRTTDSRFDQSNTHVWKTKDTVQVFVVLRSDIYSAKYLWKNIYHVKGQFLIQFPEIISKQHILPIYCTCIKSCKESF